jgi:hypothetical protein
MSEALTRMLKDARAFSAKVEECRHAASFNADDYRDAYGRLGRLRERYVKERDDRTLDQLEEQALRKVFDEDVFMKGMLDGRHISEHVQKRSGSKPIIRSRDNSPIPLAAETSAGSFFAGAIVTVHGPQGVIHYVNHLEQLEEAEKRILSVLDRATNTRP